jgi:hypothetical protein
MKALPTNSQANLTGGTWFVHEEPDYILRVWMSALNGKEKVYLNDVVCSEKRNLTSMSTRHEFTHEGHHFFIDVKGSMAVNDMGFGQGMFQCSLFRDGKLLGVYETVSQSNGTIRIHPAPDSKQARERALEHFRLRGLRALETYDLPEARLDLQRALAIDDTAAEIHFCLACVYSLEEEAERGIHHLRQALQHGLSGQERLRTTPQLAYLRMRPGFEEEFFGA